MRLLFVVQRYGPRIAGGAEYLVREYALRLAERDHEVSVLTSCARSYVDWANVDPAGVSSDGSVTVHRLPVRSARDNDLFGRIHQRVEASVTAGGRVAPALADLWAREIGPALDGFGEWLGAHVEEFDAVIFSGYMYAPSTGGLPLVAPFRPTLLQSVAHDEPPLRLAPVRRLMDHAAAVNCLTPEEAGLVERRFRPSGVVDIVGAGLGPAPRPDTSAAREEFGLGDDPFVVSVGRVDPGKGSLELVAYFEEFKRRHPGPLRLVLVGSEVHHVPRRDDLVVTGFVDEATKASLTGGADVLVQPSYFESFSLSLVEGWQLGRPALVQRRCEVLAGQARRSRGGLSYANYAEFDAALGVLLESPELRDELGANGRSYVTRYEWPAILDRFEVLVERSIEGWSGPNIVDPGAAPSPTG